MSDDVRVEHVGSIGRLTLNRPRAINALTHGMVSQITSALHEWADDSAVQAVVLTGEGERGLCAGGDIVAIYDDAKARGTATREFWRDEYRLNVLIARYRKPVVAVMQGLVMGGGIGLSAHASHRIVTDSTRVGMPEVGIGLVPDVGGTWLLANAPGELGTHAALTAAHLGPGDAIALGVADWYVPSEQIPQLIDSLTAEAAWSDDSLSVVTRLINDVATKAPPSSLASQREWIDECYATDSAEEIVARLVRSGVPDAELAAKEISRMSPSCVKVALAALRSGRTMSRLEEAVVQEFRVSLRCFAAPDLEEGIRAQVIDKDRNPRWDPPTLEEVSQELVWSYFAELSDEAGPELVLEEKQ